MKVSGTLHSISKGERSINCFDHTLYFQGVCMEFKALLVMDDVGGHSLHLIGEVVQVEFFPDNINCPNPAYRSRCGPCSQSTLHSELSQTPCGCNGLGG